jgi:tRNA A58 N-methylase Trm61
MNRLKKMAMPSGPRPRRVLLGPFRGLTLEIDLQTQSQLYFGLYEAELNSYIRTALRHSRWIIDVGAGAGEMSLLFAKNGRDFIAIESSAQAVGKLRRNALLNGLQVSNHQLVCKFAGTSDDRDTVKLDGILVDRTMPGLIKIDVEGQEVAVINGALELISECSALFLLIETHSQALEAECWSILEKHNMALQIVKNAWYRSVFPENRSIEHNRWIWARKARI